MNELILYKKERKIMSPYCEITFKLENGADMEDLIESFKYWDIEYRDMDKEYSSAMDSIKRAYNQ